MTVAPVRLLVVRTDTCMERAPSAGLVAARFTVASAVRVVVYVVEPARRTELSLSSAAPLAAPATPLPPPPLLLLLEARCGA